MEATSATLFTFGLAILLLSWILLLIQSWKNDYVWGLCTLILPPFAYLYGLFRLDKASQPILLALIGLFLVWIA